MKKKYLLFSIFLIASFGVFGQSTCNVNASVFYQYGSSSPTTGPSCIDTNYIYINGFASLNGGGCNSGNVFSEDFNSTPLNTNWSYIYPDTIIDNNSCGVPSPDNTDFVWMGENTNQSLRAMETSGLDLSGLSSVTVCFEMRYAIQGQPSPCEGPDLPTEGVYLQYSIDGGTTWVQLDYYSPAFSGFGTNTPLTSWGQYQALLPVAALTSSTKFRWQQGVNSSPLFDNWGLDNIFIGDSGTNDYTITYSVNNSSFTSPPFGFAQGIYSGYMNAVNPANNTYTNVYVIQMSNGTNSCYDTVIINQNNNFQIVLDSITPASCANGNDAAIYVSNPDSTQPSIEWIFWGQNTPAIYDTTLSPHQFSANSLSPGTYTINAGGSYSICYDSLNITIGNSSGCTVSGDFSPGNYSCYDSITLSAIGTECASSIVGCNNGAYFNDDFNTGQAVGWYFVQASTVSANTCGVNSIDNTNFLWMGSQSTSPRVLETNDLDLSNGGGICFEMRYAIQGQSAPCEGPDLPNEGVVLQYSIDAGTTWTQINYWAPTNNGSPGGSPLDMTVWNQFTELLPVAAHTNATRIRWIQTTSSSANYDNWGIDNVKIGDTIAPGGNYTISWQHDNYSLATGVYSGSNPMPIAAPNSNAGTNYYVVQMTDGTNTCYDTVMINSIGALINIDAVGNIVCGNDGFIMVSNAAQTSTSPLNFILSDTGVLIDTSITSGTSCTFNGLSAGVYDIVLVDPNSCSDTVTLTIMQDSLLSATLSMTPDIGAASGSATAQANGGTAPYTYLWNDANAQTTATASGLVSDWYMVIITDSNGCTYTDSIFVTRSIGLNENINQNVYIYPNPTNNLIYVSGANDFSFEIVDLKGRVLSVGRNANKISVEDFADGIYVLKLENNGFIKNFFIVKE